MEQENMLLRKHLFQTGWFCSILVGLLYVSVAVTHFFLPLEQLRGGQAISEAFFVSLAGHSLMFSVHYGLVVILALLSIPVVLAIHERIRPAHPGLVLWMTVVGILGSALAMVDFASVGIKAPRIAHGFLEASPLEKSVIVMNGLPHVDPCFLAWGLLGIWALVCNVLACKNRSYPRFLGAVGILGGGAYLLACLGSVVQMQRLVDVAVGLGGLILAPVWYVGFGIVMRTWSRL